MVTPANQMQPSRMPDQDTPKLMTKQQSTALFRDCKVNNQMWLKDCGGNEQVQASTWLRILVFHLLIL